MELPQLRHCERLAGWHGVEQGMRREAVTRANCAVGAFALGPVLAIPKGTHWVLHVAGRIAAFCNDCVQLFELNTGAPVACFAGLNMMHNIDDQIVLDRWIPFCAVDARGLLLDCVAARLMEFAPPDPYRDRSERSIAGHYFSHRTHGRDAVVTIVRVDSGPDDATVLHEVAYVQLAPSDVFALCEGGQSYLVFDAHQHTLQLFDLASRQLVRAFTLRAFHFLLLRVPADALWPQPTNLYSIALCFSVIATMCSSLGQSSAGFFNGPRWLCD